MASVKIEGVSKVYRDRQRDVAALRNFNMSAGDGQLVVLVGPSGCGKTTLLRLIAGLEAPTQGTIHIGSRCVNEVAPKDRDVAMVFQNYALYPHMTVYQNMAFGLKMRGVAKSEIDKAVRSTAELLGLSDLLDRRPNALSGGEKQRVALGRAIVRRPQVFLLDEPLSNLDARLRLHTRTELKRLHQSVKTTMIHVTHDQEEAMTMADQLIVMKDGEVQQSGTPLELYDKPANRFVASFLGNPPMNFIEGRISGEDSGLWFEGPFGRWRLPVELAAKALPLKGDAAQVGIRPEHIRLGADSLGVDEFEASRSGGGLATMDLKVSLVEPLGNCLHVHVDDGATVRLVARIPTGANVKVGERVRAVVNLQRVHVFAK